MKRELWLLAASLLFLHPASVFGRTPLPPVRAPAALDFPSVSDRSPLLPAFRPATTSTTFLHVATFDAGGLCNKQGWVAVDMTAQTGDYFHVDDYAGLAFGPVQGAKSLWCGARYSATGPLCGYASLPGYGNNWNQAWCTKACVPVSADLDVSFEMRLDTEGGYDSVTLEYTADCTGASGWTVLDGGIGVWDGTRNLSITGGYTVGGASSVRVRLRFESDAAWSDEDGLWQTEGAAHFDGLSVEGLAFEDFEDEATGAVSSNDWVSCPTPGYGVFAGLVSGTGVLQNQGDGCTSDLSCLWAFFVGSTSDYACAGFPSQKTIPYVNGRGQYFHNEIWSPLIDLAASGATLILDYQQYNDFSGDALVFPTWSVRPIVEGCPRPWIAPIWYPYFASGWTRQIHPIGPYVNLGSATAMQVSLGAIDMCGLWCGIYGSGQCHAHAPLYDNVRVYRVDVTGPQWSIRDLDQFQDNFAEISGPSTGRTRADMANDITPGSHLNSIIPGDSAVVKVSDSSAGLGIDPVAGGAAVYGYVAVFPRGQANKTGAPLSPDPVRWPVVGTWTDAGGVSWTCMRLDSSRVNGVPQPDIYCLDLNDNLFEPCDTVFFFYAARNAFGVETVAFGSNLSLTSGDRNQAANDPAEFTCLPAGCGGSRDILYVDGMDGRGAQPYWDTAFARLALSGRVDRYDVRAPTSAVSNRPAGRVKDVLQLLSEYRMIVWDCGNLSVTLGDGSGSPAKTDDYALLNDFLSNLNSVGGVYLAGDDVPSQLAGSSAAAASAFRSTHVPFGLLTGDHRPAFGVSPIATAVSGGAFTSDPTSVIHGGCPLLNDFDVMQPTGTSMNQITYGPGTPASANGALISNTTNNGSTDTGVMLAGFSLIYIRDDEEDGTLDRASFLHDVLVYLNGVPGAPTTVAPPPGVTRLEQNYPNPFNPQTTIRFSLAHRAFVTLAVYDVTGRLVRTLSGETRDAGPQRVVWDGRNHENVAVASGVYFYQLVAGDFRETRRMVLLK